MVVRLIDTPETIEPKFKGIFGLFEKLERGNAMVELPDLLFFELYFVLTKFYKIPKTVVSNQLKILLSF